MPTIYRILHTWLNPGKFRPMLTLFFMRMFGWEKLILRPWRLSICSGDVKQDAVLLIRPGTRFSPPGSGRIRCSGTSPPPDEGDVGDKEGLDVELTDAPGEVAEFRSPAAPRPEPGLAALSHALYCCPGPFRCSDPRSLRPDPGLPSRDIPPVDDPGKFPSLFCDHMTPFPGTGKGLTLSSKEFGKCHQHVNDIQFNVNNSLVRFVAVKLKKPYKIIRIFTLKHCIHFFPQPSEHTKKLFSFSSFSTIFFLPVLLLFLCSYKHTNSATRFDFLLKCSIA